MKLAILGTGKIVEEVLPVLQEINGIELSAILSTPRSIEKAEKLAELYAISQASSDYDNILANPEVDTVYVLITCIMTTQRKLCCLANTSFVKSHLR